MVYCFSRLGEKTHRKFFLYAAELLPFKWNRLKKVRGKSIGKQFNLKFSGFFNIGYNGGFHVSKLRPSGKTVFSLWIQFCSTLSLNFLVSAVFEAIWIKSSTYIVKSSTPWWSGWLKWSWISILCLGFMFLIVLKWPWKRFIRRRPVSPTYWRLHVLHSIQYIMLWLLQQMFVFETYLRPVTLLVIVPSVFRIGQYLQIFVFQHYFRLAFSFLPFLERWTSKEVP